MSELLLAKVNGRKSCIKRNILVSYMEFDREKIEGDFEDEIRYRRIRAGFIRISASVMKAADA